MFVISKLVASFFECDSTQPIAVATTRADAEKYIAELQKEYFKRYEVAQKLRDYHNNLNIEIEVPDVIQMPALPKTKLTAKQRKERDQINKKNTELREAAYQKCLNLKTKLIKEYAATLTEPEEIVNEVWQNWGFLNNFRDPSLELFIHEVKVV